MRRNIRNVKKGIGIFFAIAGIIIVFYTIPIKLILLLIGISLCILGLLIIRI